MNLLYFSIGFLLASILYVLSLLGNTCLLRNGHSIACETLTIVIPMNMLIKTYKIAIL